MGGGLLKKTALLKDTFREFKKSFSRFISILLIVAVGSGFFVGIKATAPSMLGSAESYFESNDLMDLEIISTVGFSEEDIEELKKIEGFEKIEPAYSADLLLPLGEQVYVAKILSITSDSENDINIPNVISGRLPEAADECLVNSPYLVDLGFELGQEITFSDTAGESETSEIVSESTYTIVGFADFPQYISYNFGSSSIGDGSVDCVIMVPAENFLYERYTEVYLTLDCYESGISAFGKDYEKVLEKLSDEITLLGNERYELFVLELEKEFEKEKDEAEGELDDAKEKLDAAAEDISEGLVALEQGWSDYEQGKIDAETQIANSEQQIADTRKKLKESEEELEKGEREYEKARKEVDDQFSDARNELDEGWAQYNAMNDEYQAGLQEYQTGLEYYEGENAKLDPIREEIGAIESELAAEEAAKAENEAAIAGVQNEIAASESNINSLRAQIDALDPESETYEEDKAALEAEISAEEKNIASLSEELAGLEAFDNSAEIEALQAQLDGKEAELAAGEAELADLKQQLDDGKVQLDAAEEELSAAKAELDEGEAQYAEAVGDSYDELDDARAELDEARSQIDKGYEELAAAEAQLASAKAQLRTELDSAYNELLESEKELDDAQDEYNKSKSEYDEAFEKAESEISSGMNRIQNLKQNINDVEAGKWYVFGRNDIMINYESFIMDAERVDAIANVFPIFFIAVASLVCLTTMSRMVDEQRTQIGIYSALGYSSGTIFSKYAIYSIVASVIGGIIGSAACVFVMPRVIFAAYTSLYYLPAFIIDIPWIIFVISIIVSLCCTVLVAYICCRKELKNAISSLMRPKVPKSGKRIWLEKIGFVWNKLSFSHKLTARNLFRYKVRLVMTVLGISGCMALIIAGFGLNYGISPIVNLQFDEIVRYDIMMSTDKSYPGNEIFLIQKDLEEDERVELAMPVYELTGKIYNDNPEKTFPDTIIFLPREVENFDKLVNLRDPKTGETLKLDDSGVIITKKAADKMGLSVGDDFVFVNETEEHTLKVSGITENYIYSYIYITPDYYREVFETAPTYNKIYAVSSENMGDTGEFVSDWLKEKSELILIFFINESRSLMNDTMNSLKLVVLVIILFAGALAFIVVYNLTNINISERIREIATIKVLGFKHREVNNYIFRENMIMCVLGILLGAVLGYFMTLYILSAVEVNMVTFSREFHLDCYFYAAGLTLLFTVLVNAYMTKRLKAIDMVDSLKAVE